MVCAEKEKGLLAVIEAQSKEVNFLHVVIRTLAKLKFQRQPKSETYVRQLDSDARDELRAKH
eukprot:2948356-Pyramimonas_sp.AAC.1